VKVPPVTWTVGWAETWDEELVRYGVTSAPAWMPMPVPASEKVTRLEPAAVQGHDGHRAAGVPEGVEPFVTP
jgi:hypothetical protein